MSDGGTVSLEVYEALRDAPDVATSDYLRCEVGGATLRERAEDRGVARGTVGANVSRAKEYVGDVEVIEEVDA